jgi:hypothetical protein
MAWKAKVGKIVTLSSTETENYATSEIAKEQFLLRKDVSNQNQV